jgi:kinesin family protein C1
MQVAFSSYQEHHGMSEPQQIQVIARLKQQVERLCQQIQSTEMELGAEQGSTAELQARNTALKQQLGAAEFRRMELHNVIQELKGNIRVLCRIRPLAPGSEASIFQPEPNKIVVSHGLDSHAFVFDRVFPPATAQVELFSEVSGLVQSALDGYKVCIFAYGQTGSGKTYTMQGPEVPGQEGLIPRTIAAVYHAAQEMRVRGWTWSVKVSCIEVENENLRDLLRGSGDAAAGPIGPTDGHVIAHDAWGTVVTGMTCIEVDSINHVKSLVGRAARQRDVGCTDIGEQSSQSHLVFAVHLKGINNLIGSEVYGALNLVDLAGSDRLAKTPSTREQIKETQTTNRSLSCLADVFAAKAEGRTQIPFRNSKLTHLIEPCLSGHGKTLMVATVQQEIDNAYETLCSLRFARQVGQCSTGSKPRRSMKNLGQSPAASSPRTIQPRTIGSSTSLSLEKAGQVGSPRRAASTDPAGDRSSTSRSRQPVQQGPSFSRTESYERSPREPQRRSLKQRFQTS